MNQFFPEKDSVNICFACEDKFAPHLEVCLCSLLCNADKNRFYDILILHKNISAQNRVAVRLTAKKYPNVKVRFVDMSEYDSMVEYSVGAYYTVETNYRLFLFSDMFADYERMIYLDCDTIVTGDISELFDTELGENALGAATSVGAKAHAFTERAVFEGNTPYHIKTYLKRVIGLDDIGRYFNAGVLLMNLKKCRELVSFRKVLDTLHSRHFFYNDQDVLNILFKDSLEPLDIRWNYTINIESVAAVDEINALYKNFKRDDYKIVHYTGPEKPWNSNVPLGELYNKYKNILKGE